MNVTVCQSCGMPLTTPAQFGTEADGGTTREYCIYCYKDGKFAQPGITLEGMTEMCTTILKEEGMDEESARSMLRNQLPFLKRWRIEGNAGNAQDGAATVANAPIHAGQPVRYVTLPGKRLAGLSARTTNAMEMSGQGSIGALWSRYFASEHIPAAEAARYGCYTDYADGIVGEYTILIGHEVGESELLPEEFDEVQLPPATYAVFTSRTGPMVEVVSEVWEAVWAWSHQS
ncbi:zinc ribbon domain-containing protein [Paenibacillus amylolyticus]|nr:zinc ribbon domain-containing protein [Paenibacillus amylolyticus]WFR63157.1 zinc ribbon domain-containing protein [Paenibacillus amylolyticus]